MIVIKADAMIKAVFKKTIKVMGMNVEWNETFIINNNSIILPGTLKSLVFNFDKRKVFGTVVDITIKEEARLMLDNQMLENAFNILLYIFGKWGQIKGLTVEKNYNQLQKMINNVLEDIDVRADFTKEKCKFYQNNMQMTYEEVIDEFLAVMKSDYFDENSEDEQDISDHENTDTNNDRDKATSRNQQNQEVSEEDDLENKGKSYKEKYKIGLWHKMVWKSEDDVFKKEKLSKLDRLKSRFCKNFYICNYRCPNCGQLLYMAVYPVGKEFRIETDEGMILLARTFTCKSCNRFYTPRPYKMIIEGNVYMLDFDEDKSAYDDYLQLAGENAERTANCNYNMYEIEYRKRSDSERLKQQENSKSGEARELADFVQNIDDAEDEDVLEIRDKMDSDFYSEQSVKKYDAKINQEMKKRAISDTETVRKKKKTPHEDRNHHLNDKGGSKEEINKAKISKEEINRGKISREEINREDIDREKINREESIRTEYLVSSKLDESADNVVSSAKNDKLNHNLDDEEQQDTGSRKENTVSAEPMSEQVDKEVEQAVTYMIEDNKKKFEESVHKLIISQLKKLKNIIMSDNRIDEKKKKDYYDQTGKVLVKKQETDFMQKAADVKNQSYDQMRSVLEEIKKEDCPVSVKEPVMKGLLEWMKARGNNELKILATNIPDNITRGQYKKFKEKLNQYHDIDNSAVIKILDDKRDNVEKKEIAQFITKHNLNPNDRNSVADLSNQLKEQDFEEKNIRPVIENLHNRIYELDRTEIHTICPDVSNVTFDEGMLAYKKISEGNYLPELKVDILARIDRKLREMKQDECEHLVRKLTRDIGWNAQDYPGIYMYDVRRMSREDNEDEDCIIVNNAMNTYAADIGQYEYPIMVCDSSHGSNGKKGFMITPDHIYYKSSLTSGLLNVKDIENIYTESGLFNKGVYAKYANVGGIKMSNPLKNEKVAKDSYDNFITKVNEFIAYLQEKPDSRSISYMAKEKHPVKCCYRCGFVYETGNVCPKCGSANND